MADKEKGSEKPIKQNAKVTNAPSVAKLYAKQEIEHFPEKILSNIGVGIYIVQKGKFVYVSSIYQKMSGYSEEELLNQDSLRWVHPDDREKAKMSAISALKHERFDPYEYRFVKKNGEIIWILEMVASFNYQGERAALGSFMDITGYKLIEALRLRNEAKYHTILEEMDNAYFEVDLAGNYTFVNDAITRLMGYEKEELLGTTFRNQVDEEGRKILYSAFGNIFNSGQPERGISYKAYRKDGACGFAEISGFPIYNQNKDVIGFRGIGRDVTEKKLMEESLRQSEERYRTIMEEMDEWYFETDLKGNILFVNEAAIRALNHLSRPLIGENYRAIFNEKEAAAIYEKFHIVYETGKPYKNFALDIFKTGEGIISAEFNILPKRNAEGNIYGFRGVGHDITERKRAEKQIQYLATHDGLTGLPNRVLFSQMLNHAIQAARRYQRIFAIFFIDLDRFKIINDTLGHDAGDMLLREISIRFKQTLRAVDTVARMGGDEFVILIEEVSDISYVTSIAQKILCATIKPLTLVGRECRITASIGISLYPRDGEDEQTLMKNADIAMYFAKEEGKNNFQFYSQQIKVQSVERLFMEAKLRSALERNELSLQYQAKLDVKTGAITGMEALLRWNNPQLGSVPPVQFLPVAEETGMILPIGRWVLKTACAQNVAWQRQGLPSLCMSVNLSLRQLTDEHLIEDIKTALNESGMNPNLLELEITEGMLMHNPMRMSVILDNIKDLGVRLAIDNFGTGYSSLSNIRNFPIDALKIDRSFMRNIMENIEDKAITQAIISMGKTLCLTIVAEGVETKDQMTFLREQSCDEMQGFHFSKPVEPEKFVALLKNNLPLPENSD